MDSQPLILICDHRGEGVAERLFPLRAAGYRTEITRNLRQTLARLKRVDPILLLVDPLTAGGEVELETIEKSRPHTPVTPVLVVADTADPLPAIVGVRSLAAGSWDVVHRNAPLEEYLMRIEQLVEVHEIRHRAAHDDRTDLLRPAAFEERLAEHFSAAQRHKLGLALAIVDLDQFKRINDENKDHSVGDWVIAEVGAAIRSTLRTEDVAGRLGGDEFGVLLPYTGKLESASVVQRLLDAIRAVSGWPPGAAGEVQVSASVGFETYDGSDLDTLETLRQHAEQAVYAAKKEGGDRGVYYRGLNGR